MVLISMRKIKRNDKRRVMTSLYVKSSTVNFHRPVHSIAYADHHLRLLRPAVVVCVSRQANNGSRKLMEV